MEDLAGYIEWMEKALMFRAVSLDLIGKDAGEKAVLDREYHIVSETVKRLENVNYSPRAVGKISSGNLAVLATALSSSFHQFFIKQKIIDSDYPKYIRDVILALEEPYRAVPGMSKRREFASKLLDALAVQSYKYSRQTVPEGNI